MPKRFSALKRVILCATLSLAAAGLAQARERPASLRIYFIDVEGGQSTLIRTPAGESLLIDTGYAGDGLGFKPGEPTEARDANRIVAAARDAQVTRINYLLITHFHDDHDGGVRELSQLLPIDAFIDHGSPSPQVASNTGVEQLDAYRVYSAVRSGSRHLVPRPGMRLPLKGLEATVVSSAGETLTTPMRQAGSNNTACQSHAEVPRDPYENPRSTGVIVEYGKFRFLDVGDLSGKPLYDLVCPRDLIGSVDAYLVAHHGGPDVADAEIFQALRPRVAIMNNGIKKGGARITYERLHQIESLKDTWQLHASDDAAETNFAPERIANLDDSTAFWIELEAHSDGSFKVLNRRTGEWVAYPKR